MATFALLHVSITAVSSDWYSGFIEKPEVSMTRALRPGTVDRLLARLRTASSTACMPKPSSALLRDGAIGGGADDATITGGSALGETVQPFKPITTCFKRFASAVKFCEM